MQLMPTLHDLRHFHSAQFDDAGFAVFAIFVMPMLKVDPNEYKELMGKKDQDALPSGSSEGRASQQRLQ